jgi:hypothetical protein
VWDNSASSSHERPGGAARMRTRMAQPRAYRRRGDVVRTPPSRSYTTAVRELVHARGGTRPLLLASRILRTRGGLRYAVVHSRSTPCTCDACYGLDSCLVALSLSRSAAPEPNVGRTWIRRPYSTIVQLYKVQQFRCYRSGPRRLLGEYGGIEADRQTTSSRQQAAADS